MHAVSANQITNILHFNDNVQYHELSLGRKSTNYICILIG